MTWPLIEYVLGVAAILLGFGALVAAGLMKHSEPMNEDWTRDEH